MLAPTEAPPEDGLNHSAVYEPAARFTVNPPLPDWYTRYSEPGDASAYPVDVRSPRGAIAVRFILRAVVLAWPIARRTSFAVGSVQSPSGGVTSMKIGFKPRQK